MQADFHGRGECHERELFYCSDCFSTSQREQREGGWNVCLLTRKPRDFQYNYDATLHASSQEGNPETRRGRAHGFTVTLISAQKREVSQMRMFWYFSFYIG